MLLPPAPFETLPPANERMFELNKKRFDHSSFVLGRRVNEQVDVLGGAEITSLDDSKTADDHIPRAEPIQFSA